MSRSRKWSPVFRYAGRKGHPGVRSWSKRMYHSAQRAALRDALGQEDNDIARDHSSTSFNARIHGVKYDSKWINTPEDYNRPRRPWWVK